MKRWKSVYMQMRFSFILLIGGLLVSDRIMAQQADFHVEVHEGIELLTVVQTIAKRTAPYTASSYGLVVRKHFRKYKNHEAVKQIRNMMNWKDSNISPDLTDIGIYIQGFPQPKAVLPNHLHWYEKYSKEAVVKYINDCIDFYHTSGFRGFFEERKNEYQAWSKAILKNEDENQYHQKLADFLNYNKDVSWYIFMDPLNNWGSHAIMDQLDTATIPSRIMFQTGYWSEKASHHTPPVFEGEYRYLIWHEGSHAYIDHLMTTYEGEIARLGHLFNKEHPVLAQQSIKTWSYCLNENIVRAIAAALYRLHLGEDAYKKLLEKELEQGFVYVDTISRVLLSHYQTRTEGECFDDVFPQILHHLSTLKL